MTDARALTFALRGRWHGRYGTAACPCCQPEGRRDQAALSIGEGSGGRLLLHCHKSGCDFAAILAAAGLRAGDYRAPDPAALARRAAEEQAEARRRSEQARRLWAESQPIEGTLAETYLRAARGIRLERLPRTLRFHSEAWHGPTARRWPAMIAAVQGVLLPAIHRTFLRPDGSGKAPIEPAKAALGAIAGGAARLVDGPGTLVVAEGVETALAAWCLRGDPTARAWAALSASGLRTLRLPPRPGRLCVAADGDSAGMDAAQALAERAHGLGWQVTIAAPPAGCDWADVLREGVAA